MDKVTLIMFIGLSGFILFLFFYIINRDKIIENKMAGLELGLEEINQEIFKLKKEVKTLKENNGLDEVDSIIEEIVDSIKKVEKNYNEKLKELEDKINVLENNSKRKIFDFSNVNTQDEERIKALYKSGYSIEEISRELRIPAGEIELVLKFSNLN
jgi:septal ring factor EnvC (AmiA/AmiB activator)